MPADSFYSLETTTLQGKPAALDGKVIAFFDSEVTPESKELRDQIEAALGQ